MTVYEIMFETPNLVQTFQKQLNKLEIITN